MRKRTNLNLQREKRYLRPFLGLSMDFLCNASFNFDKKLYCRQEEFYRQLAVKNFFRSVKPFKNGRGKRVKTGISPACI